MIPAKKIKKPYTYAEYLQWDDSIRVELINGDVYDMSPAPSLKHQDISMYLSAVIRTFLNNKKCRVFAAPFDVRLAEKGLNDTDITAVVQPDISVICDSKKLDSRGCIGAPDMIIEIISPDTAAKDMREKLDLYEKHGVKEYWIIQPAEKILMVYYRGKNGNYSKPAVYAPPDVVKVKTLRGLSIDLLEMFKD